MRKILSMLFTFILAITVLVSCSTPKKSKLNMEPDASQMKAICELAVMECYYHNVAKYFEEDAQGVLLWKKDKHFWIEYSGVVKLGIDISLVNIEIDNTIVNITLPAAKVLGVKVDSDSLSKDSFIVAKKSADIKAIDEVKAFAVAQSSLEETAANDTVLLANAQQRAQNLLEDYIINIGTAVDKQYTIKWIYTDVDGNTIGTETTNTNESTSK